MELRLNKDVYSALRSIDTTSKGNAGVNETEMQAIEAAIKKDGKLDEGEQKLLETLKNTATWNDVKISCLEPKQVSFTINACTTMGAKNEVLKFEMAQLNQSLSAAQKITDPSKFSLLKEALDRISDGSNIGGSIQIKGGVGLSKGPVTAKAEIGASLGFEVTKNVFEPQYTVGFNLGMVISADAKLGKFFEAHAEFKQALEKGLAFKDSQAVTDFMTKLKVLMEAVSSGDEKRVGPVMDNIKAYVQNNTYTGSIKTLKADVKAQIGAGATERSISLAAETSTRSVTYHGVTHTKKEWCAEADFTSKWGGRDMSVGLEIYGETITHSNGEKPDTAAGFNILLSKEFLQSVADKGLKAIPKEFKDNLVKIIMQSGSALAGKGAAELGKLVDQMLEANLSKFDLKSFSGAEGLESKYSIGLDFNGDGSVTFLLGKRGEASFEQSAGAGAFVGTVKGEFHYDVQIEIPKMH